MKKIIKCFLNLFKKKKSTPKFPKPENNVLDWNKDEQQLAMLMRDYLHEVNPDIQENKLLHDLAVDRCKYLIEREKVSHDGVGTAFEAILAEGYIMPAEILGYAYKTAQTMLNGWKKSVDHDKTILNPKHRYYGIGIVEHKGKKYYCTLFAR